MTPMLFHSQLPISGGFLLSHGASDASFQGPNSAPDRELKPGQTGLSQGSQGSLASHAPLLTLATPATLANNKLPTATVL